MNISPPGSPGGISATGVFAGFLVLDALVANMDRHDENWALLVAPGVRPVLAPTFDHASSLGFQLSDEERDDRLSTTDRGRTVDAYAARGRSRHFEGSPTLVDLAVRCCRLSDTTDYWHSTVEAIAVQHLEELAEALPATRMSRSARTFAVRLMTINRRRLLDELTSG